VVIHSRAQLRRRRAFSSFFVRLSSTCGKPTPAPAGAEAAAAAEGVRVEEETPRKFDLLPSSSAGKSPLANLARTFFRPAPLAVVCGSQSSFYPKEEEASKYNSHDSISCVESSSSSSSPAAGCAVGLGLPLWRGLEGTTKRMEGRAAGEEDERDAVESNKRESRTLSPLGWRERGGGVLVRREGGKD